MLILQASLGICTSRCYNLIFWKIILDAIHFGLEASKYQVGVWPCHSQGGNQYWLLSKKGELRRDDACLDFGGKDVSKILIQ